MIRTKIRKALKIFSRIKRSDEFGELLIEWLNMYSGGSRGGTPSTRPPKCPNSFVLTTNFTKHSRVGTLRGWRPLLQEILDPPLMYVSKKRIRIKGSSELSCVSFVTNDLTCSLVSVEHLCDPRKGILLKEVAN